MSRVLARVVGGGLAFLALCCVRNEETSHQKSMELPSVGDMLFVSDSQQNLILEAVNSSEVAVHDSKTGHSCAITPDLAHAWQDVRDAASSSSIVVRHKVVLDPNRDTLRAVVAYVRAIDNGQFGIQYIEDVESMVQAAEALDEIFASCGLDFRVRIKCEETPNR